MLEIVFVFLFVDLFDNIGTLVGVGKKAGLFDNANQIPRIRRILLSDATSTIAGSLAGTSTVVSYIESAAGVVAGGRSGVTAIVTGLLFIAALFVAPIVGAVPGAATAPALIIVGSLMMSQVNEIRWSDPIVAIPAFLTLITIPLTFSIANGLAFGFTSYAILKICLKANSAANAVAGLRSGRSLHRALRLSGKKLKNRVDSLRYVDRVLSAGQDQHVARDMRPRFGAVDFHALRRVLQRDQSAGAALIGELDAAGGRRGRFQLAIEIEQCEPAAASGPARSCARRAGSHSLVSSATGHGFPVHQRRTFAQLPREPRAAPRFDDQLFAHLIRAVHRGRSGASSGRSGAKNRVFEIQRHARKRRRGHVDQLEQFRAGLLLGGIDVLIALDDVDVDRQLVLRGRQRAIARRDLRIALRPQVPDGRRILDQEREIVRAEHAAARATASAPIFSRMVVSKRSSTWVSARSRCGLVSRIASISAIHSACWRWASSARNSRNRAKPGGFFASGAATAASNSSIGSNPAELAELGAHVVVHRREARRILDALRAIRNTAPPDSRRPNRSGRSARAAPCDTAAKAVAIGQVHQLAPVELRVLQQRRLFAPLRMIVPELLADVRQFQPCVNQDRLAMAGLDQSAQIFVALRIALPVMPRRDVQRADAGGPPARGEIIEIDPRPVRRIEERP